MGCEQSKNETISPFCDFEERKRWHDCQYTANAINSIDPIYNKPIYVFTLEIASEKYPMSIGLITNNAIRKGGFNELDPNHGIFYSYYCGNYDGSLESNDPNYSQRVQKTEKLYEKGDQIIIKLDLNEKTILFQRVRGNKGDAEKIKLFNEIATGVNIKYRLVVYGGTVTIVGYQFHPDIKLDGKLKCNI